MSIWLIRGEALGQMGRGTGVRGFGLRVETQSGTAREVSISANLYNGDRRAYQERRKRSTERRDERTKIGLRVEASTGHFVPVWLCSSCNNRGDPQSSGLWMNLERPETVVGLSLEQAKDKGYEALCTWLRGTADGRLRKDGCQGAACSRKSRAGVGPPNQWVQH